MNDTFNDTVQRILDENADCPLVARLRATGQYEPKEILLQLIACEGDCSDCN